MGAEPIPPGQGVPAMVVRWWQNKHVDALAAAPVLPEVAAPFKCVYVA
jgi:hypothetical protein